MSSLIGLGLIFEGLLHAQATKGGGGQKIVTTVVKPAGDTGGSALPPPTQPPGPVGSTEKPLISSPLKPVKVSPFAFFKWLSPRLKGVAQPAPAVKKLALFDRIKNFGRTSFGSLRKTTASVARKILPKNLLKRILPPPPIPDRESPLILQDVIVCDGEPRLSPLSPTGLRPWWPAYVALKATDRPEAGKDPLIKGAAGPSNRKSPYQSRVAEGSLPYACPAGQEWNETMRRCLPFNHRCSIFNAVGVPGLAPYPRYQREGSQVTITEPSSLFSGPIYTGLLDTDTATGKRTIVFVPNKPHVFQHTQKPYKLGNRQPFAANDARPHAYRKFWNREPLLPNNPNSNSGWALHVSGECVLEKTHYPATNNESLLSESKDPCGLRALLDPRSRFWSKEYRPTDLKPTVLLEGHPPEGREAGRYRYVLLPVPNSKYMVESLGCGNYNTYRLQLLRTALGQKAFWNPIRDPNVSQPNSTMEKTAGTGSTGAPDSPALPTEACPPGGVNYPDIVDTTLASIGPLEPVSENLVRVPAGTSVNWTSLLSENHPFDPRENGNDLFLGHSLSFVTALQATLSQLWDDVNAGVFPPYYNRPAGTVAPNVAELSAGRPNHPVLNTALYLLTRLLEEAYEGRLRFAWGNLASISPAMGYYDAASQTVILDRTLEPSTRPEVIAPAKYRIGEQGVEWRSDAHVQDESVKGMKNIAALFPSLLHTGFHHVLYVDGASGFGHDEGGHKPTPQMSLVGEATVPGRGEELPQKINPCCGIYFHCRDGRLCEERSGYLDGETCEPVMSTLTDPKDVVSQEALISLASLLAQHELEKVRRKAIELRCSMGRLTAGCSPYPETLCSVYRRFGERSKACIMNDSEDVPVSCRPGDRHCIPQCPKVDGLFVGECMIPRRAPCINPRIGCWWDETTVPPCEKKVFEACEEVDRFGSCSSFVSPGPLRGILCDPGADKLIGDPEGPFEIPNPGGGGTPPRPENLRPPAELIHDLLANADYEVALEVAGRMVSLTDILPLAAGRPSRPDNPEVE